MQPSALFTLASLQPGQSGTIDRFIEQDSRFLRWMELGLLPGTPVKLVRVAPLGDPLEFEFRGYRLSLRREEAALILLQPKS